MKRIVSFIQIFFQIYFASSCVSTRSGLFIKVLMCPLTDVLEGEGFIRFPFTFPNRPITVNEEFGAYFQFP